MSDDIREMLHSIRNYKYGELKEEEDKFVNAHSKMLLKEDVNDDESDAQDAVPYSKNDDIYSNSVEAAKNGFSAKFPDPNPVLYYPAENDVVVSGQIPSLKNAKFRFSYKDSGEQGCYIWVDSLQLTTDVLTTLNKVMGVFKNWKDSLNKIDDLKPLSMNGN